VSPKRFLSAIVITDQKKKIRSVNRIQSEYRFMNWPGLMFLKDDNRSISAMQLLINILVYIFCGLGMIFPSKIWVLLCAIIPKRHFNHFGNTMVAYIRGERIIAKDRVRRLTNKEKEFVKKLKLALKRQRASGDRIKKWLPKKP